MVFLLAELTDCC